jgi:hypothetical protein
MNSISLADVDALSRKAVRLLGLDQFAALTPSQRAMLTLQLQELLEKRATKDSVTPDDVRMIFENIAGFSPHLCDRDPAGEDL